MNIRQQRIAFRILFLLPVIGLGIALFVAGVARTISQWQGQAIADDLLSGPLTIGLSLLPMGAFALLAWVVARRPQRLPRPRPDAIPASNNKAFWRALDSPQQVESAGDVLNIKIELHDHACELTLTKRDHWRPGALIAAALLIIAAWIGPASLDQGTLAWAPINATALVAGSYLALFALLISLPLSARRVEFRAEEDALVITQGRRSRVLGLSRLRALEARRVAESQRDSEIQTASSTRWHPVLIGWFDVEDRGPEPFALITGPRNDRLEAADKALDAMTLIAQAVASSLQIESGLPAGASADSVPYD